MDSKLFNDLVEAYQLVHSTENIEEKNGGVSKKKETKFHTKLDKLVHKTFGKSPEEQKEDTSYSDDVEQLDEISADLAMKATKAADEKRRVSSIAGDKETAAAKAQQASRIYSKVGKLRAKERTVKLNKEEFDIFDAVLEFLYVEGYAETLEEAKEMMVSLTKEDIDTIIETRMDPRGRPASGPMNVYANPKNKPSQAHLDAVKAHREKEAKKSPEQRKAELDAYIKRQRENK
jgi:hypothetical protein